MKKLIALFTALTLLTPAMALAEGPGPGGIRGNVMEHEASSTNSNRGPGGKLGPAIRDLASSTRAEWKNVASTTREAVRAKLDALHALIDEHKDEMQKRAEDARTKAHEHFGENVEKLVGKVSDHLASTSARLTTLLDRLDGRIDELKDKGFAMSSSTALLAIAQADLVVANDKITTANAALDSAMSTTTPKTLIPEVRAAVKAAEDALKLVKDDLQKTLRAIRVEGASTTTTSI